MFENQKYIALKNVCCITYAIHVGLLQLTGTDLCATLNCMVPNGL